MAHQQLLNYIFKYTFYWNTFSFAKDNHQFYNAKFYEEKDCCWLYNQKDISLDKMLDLFNSIIENPENIFKKI